MELLYLFHLHNFGAINLSLSSLLSFPSLTLEVCSSTIEASLRNLHLVFQSWKVLLSVIGRLTHWICLFRSWPHKQACSVIVIVRQVKIEYQSCIFSINYTSQYWWMIESKFLRDASKRFLPRAGCWDTFTFNGLGNYSIPHIGIILG